MNRSDVLNRADEVVNGERQDQYGNPEDNFSVIAEFFETYIKNKCVFQDEDGSLNCEIGARDIANLMILFKVGRLTTGAGSEDTYIDIAGYAACGGAMFNEEDCGETTTNADVDDDWKKIFYKNLFKQTGECCVNAN